MTTKLLRILGKRGRITIPYEIRQRVGFAYNDVLSFTESGDGNSVIVRREKLCDNCQDKTVQAVTDDHATPPPAATPAPTPAPTPESPAPTPAPAEPIPTPAEPTSEPVIEEPSFDIGYWIGYAQSCAQGLGLRLESSAVDCWDNPIGAGPHSTCLERDISSRLNRYANDPDITDVWVWYESTGNNTYNIYIGYA